jgi:hypothetical protein
MSLEGFAIVTAIIAWFGLGFYLVNRETRNDK